MPGIFVYGSCVSRDARAFLSADWELTGYVARQGFLSAATGEVPIAGTSSLTSAFQKRCLEWDARGEALNLIAAEASRTDVVLVDLVDERLGSYRSPSGAHLTNSWEFGCSGLLGQQPESWELIEFGTDEHFALWSEAASSVFEELLALDVKVLVLAPDWSERTDEDVELSYRGQPVSAWNARYERYTRQCSNLGVPVVVPPKEYAVSASKHQWGIAPYHYVDELYEYVCREIETFAAKPAGD